MTAITKKTGIGLSHEAAFWVRFLRTTLTVFTVASLMFGVSRANASCGTLLGGSKSPVTLPMLGQAANSEDDSDYHGHEDSIVGLWHVVYTAGGETFNETFDQWHSDGTEFENADLSPLQGNICFGVWKPVAPRKVRLHHIGWTFDAANGSKLNGTFTLDEVNIVSRDGKTYSGTFTFTTYDLNGETGVVVKGTMLARRITVE